MSVFPSVSPESRDAVIADHQQELARIATALERIADALDRLTPSIPPAPPAATTGKLNGKVGRRGNGSAITSAAASRPDAWDAPPAPAVRAAACATLGLNNPAVLATPSRTRPVSRARQVVAWALREVAGWSLTRAAAGAGYANHTTLYHSLVAVQDAPQRSPMGRAAAAATVAVQAWRATG